MAPPRPPLTILYLPIVNWSAKYFPSDDTLKDKDEDKDKDKEKDKDKTSALHLLYSLFSDCRMVRKIFPHCWRVTSNVFSQAGSPGALPDSLIL